MKQFLIFLPEEGVGNVWIDTVFFNENCDPEYVRKSLIDHDGFDPEIVVKGA